METPPSAAPAPKPVSAARSLSVLLCGALFIGAGLYAAYLAFADRARTPAPLAGRAAREAPVPTLGGLPSAPRVRIAWRSWGPEAFKESGATGRLILLDVTSSWSHWSRLMDLGTYGDERVARWIEANVLPVRVDRDARPDLARRYGLAVPSTGLLLPTGETLADASYAAPEAFLAWGDRVATAWRTSRDRVLAARDGARRDALAKAGALLGPGRDRRWASLSPEERVKAASDAIAAALKAIGLSETRPRRFPSHGAHRLLAELTRTPFGTGTEVAYRYRSLLQGLAKLEDPAWGGIFRYSRCADWSCPEREKLLGLQAEAVSDAAEAAALGLGAEWEGLARRTAVFVETWLRLPTGRYAASLSADVAGPRSWVDGDRYYSLGDAERRALGVPAADGAAYAAAHAELAAAYFASAGVLKDPALVAAAEAALAGLDKATSADGSLAHRLDVPGGERGLLDDQLAAARAALAGYRAKPEPKRLASARRWLAWARKNLKDPASGGLRVRSPREAPVAGWTEPVSPDQTAVAALLLAELAELTGKPEDRSEAAAAADWVLARADAVDPVVKGLVAVSYLRRNN